MSRIGLTKGTAPGTPPAGVVYLYPKADGRFYFKNEAGVEEPMKSVGAGSGDLLADGSVPLTANWAVGAFKITAAQLESDIAPGTAPMIVASNTVVANLNADFLDGQEGSYYASVAYVDAAVVGLLEHKGGYNAATNTPDLDTAPSGIKTGDAYVVTAAGTFYAVELEVGDWLYANQDDPTASNEWTIVQYNIEGLDPNALLKSNLNASVDPTTTDDSAAGYGVGSKWVNTTADTIWFCLDDTASAAVWQDVGGGGGVVWSYATTSQAVAAGTGTAFHDMAATVTATLPAAPALNDVVWIANNDNTAGAPYNVTITAGGTNEIREMNVTGIPTLTLTRGQTCVLVCQDAGATKKWGLFRMDGQSSGGGGLTVEFKTASFTAEAGKKYMVDSSGGAVVVTLPAGVNLDNIMVQDVGHVAGTFPITINPDGAETIDLDTTFVIDQNDGDVDLGYNSGTTNWQVSADGTHGIATIGPLKVRTVRTLIETITNATAGEFDFSGIASGYDRLIIKGRLQSDVAGTFDFANIYLNGDTTDTNYHHQINIGYNGSGYTTEGAAPTLFYVGGAGSPSTELGNFTIEIENPNSTDPKSVVTYGGHPRTTTELVVGGSYITSSVTAAITQLRVRTDNHATDQLFGTLTLYGEKDEEIGGGNSFEGINDQTATTYQFINTDLVDGVVANNAAASTYSIPDALGKDGSLISLYNKGAGTVTIDMAGTSTLDTADNKCATKKAITIMRISSTVWAVIGGSA